VHIHTTLFDTLDDGQPGGRLTEETATVVHGPHPGFAGRLALCGIAAELSEVAGRPATARTMKRC
jgi:hypothetical protein